MALVNQAGKPIVHEKVEYHEVSNDECRVLLFKLLEAMNLSVIRTNGTKHGNTELQIHSNPME